MPVGIWMPEWQPAIIAGYSERDSRQQPAALLVVCMSSNLPPHHAHFRANVAPAGCPSHSALSIYEWNIE